MIYGQPITLFIIIDGSDNPENTKKNRAHHQPLPHYAFYKRHTTAKWVTYILALIQKSLWYFNLQMKVTAAKCYDSFLRGNFELNDGCDCRVL